MLIVPFDPLISADQEVEVILGDTATIPLRLYWNILNECWYVGVPGFIEPVKAVPSWPIFKISRYLLPVEGDFMMLRASDSANFPMEYETLGKQWALVYLTNEEIVAWEKEVLDGLQ